LGVSNWLKSYVQQKQNSKEQFDKDFLLYAPLLIGNHRKLSTRAYEQLVEAADYWGVGEWSVISHFRDISRSFCKQIPQHIMLLGNLLFFENMYFILINICIVLNN
jgi:hypothetical protein